MQVIENIMIHSLPRLILVFLLENSQLYKTSLMLLQICHCIQVVFLTEAITILVTELTQLPMKELHEPSHAVVRPLPLLKQPLIRK